MTVSGYIHAPYALTPEKETLCPMNMSLPGPQNFIKKGKSTSPYLQSNYDSSVVKPIV